VSMKYIAYFDSGTTNSRIYILDDALNPICTGKRSVGSRDTAITGDRSVLVDGLYGLYCEALEKCGLTDGDVGAIYASGMITSAYGLLEVPHCALPISMKDFAASVVPFEEKTRFGRTVYLVPGLKKMDENIDYVNNMRGEEIEVLGVLERYGEELAGRTVAIALPGSHTHVMFVRGGEMLGIVSNFTGELFHAVASETILSPLLQTKPENLDEDWIRKGVHNLNEFGMSRALYICRAMQVFNEGTVQQQLSYAEGVLLGGIAQSVELYCEKFYPDCRTMLITAGGEVGGIYRTIFETCSRFDTVEARPAEESLPYSLLGLRRILRVREEEGLQ